MRKSKKDLFIKEKLQEDKIIPNQISEVFNNFKEDLNMKEQNKERGVITISLRKVLAICACLIIVGFVGINLYANSMGKPNAISAIQALIKKDTEDNLDEIAKELFIKASDEIRRLEYSSIEEYVSEKPAIEKKIGKKLYLKTTSKYVEIEKRYGEIFTAEALENVLNMRYLNVDGDLYVSQGGMSGWDITNVELIQKSEGNGRIEYTVSYNDTFGFEEEQKIDEKEQFCKFTMIKDGENYKICSTNYLNININTTEIEQDENTNNFQIFVGNQHGLELTNARIRVLALLGDKPQQDSIVYTDYKGWATIKLEKTEIKNGNIPCTIFINHEGKEAKIAIEITYEDYKPVNVTTIQSTENGVITYFGVKEKNTIELNWCFGNVGTHDTETDTNETLYGDANCDGEVNLKDVVIIRRYLDGWEEYSLEGQAWINSDVNLDNKVDLFDVEAIRKYLAGGYEGYTSLPVKIVTTLYGDANCDGEVNLKDVVIIRRYLDGWEGYSLEGQARINSDVNLDNKVDSFDVEAIRKYLAGGYEGYTTLPIKALNLTGWDTKAVPGMKIKYPSNYLVVTEINRDKWNVQQGEPSCEFRGYTNNIEVIITTYEPQHKNCNYSELMRQETSKYGITYNSLIGTTGYNINSKDTEHLEWRNLMIKNAQNNDSNGYYVNEQNIYHIDSLGWVIKINIKINGIEEAKTENLNSVFREIDEIIGNIKQTSY